MSEVEVLRSEQHALAAATESLREWVRGVDGDAHMALDVARQNVKLMTALRATQLEHGNAIAALVTEAAEVKADVAEVKADVAEVKADVAEVKADVAEVKAEVAEVKGDVAELRAELKDGLAEVLRRLPAQGIA